MNMEHGNIKDFKGLRKCSICDLIKSYIFYKFNAQGKRLYVDEDGRVWNGSKCRDCLNLEIARYVNKKRKKYNKLQVKRRKLNKLARESMRFSSKLNRIVKHRIKSSSVETYLGISCQQFIDYIESLFQPGMTWSNYGRSGWELDHIIPQSKAKTINELRKLNNYANLRPMWKRLNRIKYNKTIDGLA